MINFEEYRESLTQEKTSLFLGIFNKAQIETNMFTDEGISAFSNEILAAGMTIAINLLADYHDWLMEKLKKDENL